MDDEKEKRQTAAYVMVPFVIAVSPVVGWFMGRWLDRQFGTTPYLMYLFLILGFVAGFREVYRIIKRFGNGS